jgi:flagellin-like protein
MTRDPPRSAMRHWSRLQVDRRGLAEIVGTLMLVLIVVAAATAFSYFVASEEQSNLANQASLHFKNLENVTIQSVLNTPPNLTQSGSLVVIIASSDIYATNVTEIAIGGNPATTFCQSPENGVIVDCSSPATHFQTFSAAGGQGYLNLTPFTATALTLNYTSFLLPGFTFSNESVQVQMGTLRGNEFIETLFPPIAEFGVSSISNWPVLDGTQSYQPHTASSPDASIDQWIWNVTDLATGKASGDGNYTGQEAQLHDQLTLGVTYTITLTVTNTLGLSGTAVETYKLG